ncbi:hypothetical protein ACLB2K_023814 [Fragaria x ananassa]
MQGGLIVVQGSDEDMLVFVWRAITMLDLKTSERDGARRWGIGAYANQITTISQANSSVAWTMEFHSCFIFFCGSIKLDTQVPNDDFVLRARWPPSFPVSGSRLACMLDSEMAVITSQLTMIFNRTSERDGARRWSIGAYANQITTISQANSSVAWTMEFHSCFIFFCGSIKLDTQVPNDDFVLSARWPPSFPVSG